MHLKGIEDEGEEEAEEKEDDQGQEINSQTPDFQWSSAVLFYTKNIFVYCFEMTAIRPQRKRVMSQAQSRGFKVDKKKKKKKKGLLFRGNRGMDMG